ncbi:MAG: hypothetical protein ACXAC5_01025 [Promethearchaeota archaeon]|jgi:hypothetical protein
MPEDHVIRRRFVENPDAAAEEEERKRAEMEEKVANFEWGDDEDENLEPVPFSPDISAIDHCVHKLADHLVSEISPEHFDGLDISGVRFVVPVDLDLDLLLHERFSEEWTLESRLVVFQGIQDQLSSLFAKESPKEALNQCINEALPPTHRKKFSFGTIRLFDDALTIGGEGNTISIEVPLHFVANS